MSELTVAGPIEFEPHSSSNEPEPPAPADETATPPTPAGSVASETKRRYVQRGAAASKHAKDALPGNALGYDFGL